MSNASEILNAIESAFQQKDFDSRDSIVRLHHSGSYVFEWADAEVTVKGDLAQADSIGFLLNSIEISKSIREKVDIADYLKTVAETIEKRVNYLMEPLKIIELDSTTNAVQMRSEKPEIQDGNLSYFEVILKAGKWFGYRNYVSLHRYTNRREDEENRRRVSFPVTKKQFQKLVDDLIEIM
ncbi:hypothetical protein L0222_28550 [bacterium]|nr:hypothetical protein [bacterium]MCI0602292.1 hypothetical protein [bacterium]